MRPLIVVEHNPVTNHPARMLQGFEAVAMNTLLLECPDHSFNHAVLFRAVRRDELLLQAITTDQRRIAAAGKNQTVIRPHADG